MTDKIEKKLPITTKTLRLETTVQLITSGKNAVKNPDRVAKDLEKLIEATLKEKYSALGVVNHEKTYSFFLTANDPTT